MDNNILIALIGAISGIFGCLITIVANHYTNINKKAERTLRRMLSQAYKDIAAFHRLEFLYSESLITSDQSQEGIKRLFRKRLRDRGFESPSKNSSILVAEKRAEEYSK